MGLPATAATRSLGFGQRAGRRGEQARDDALAGRVEPGRVGDHLVDQTDSPCLFGVEALAGEKVAPRLALADGGDHIGRGRSPGSGRA